MKIRPNAGVVRQLELRAEQCAIASPVWHELQYGCKLLPQGKKREALTRYLRDVVYASFPILPYDDVAAEWHAAERSRLQRLGRVPLFVDGQIAAIARNAGLALVTMDTRDFQSFQGLELENWSSAQK